MSERALHPFIVETTFVPSRSHKTVGLQPAQRGGDGRPRHAHGLRDLRRANGAVLARACRSPRDTLQASLWARSRALPDRGYTHLSLPRSSSREIYRNTTATPVRASQASKPFVRQSAVPPPIESPFVTNRAISSKTALTPSAALRRVCLVPRGRTQRTPKDGVPVAAGEGTEEGRRTARWIRRSRSQQR